MTQLTMQVTGAEIVRKGLQDLGAEIPRIGRQQIYYTASAIVRRMRTYPPPPTYSTYVRTGTLGAGWEVVSRSDGYTIRNDTPYTKYVVGNAYGLEQAWMHQDRWQLLRDVQEEEIAKLPPEIEKEISLTARRFGL
jgi:hypothetical protein